MIVIIVVVILFLLLLLLTNVTINLFHGHSLIVINTIEKPLNSV